MAIGDHHGNQSEIDHVASCSMSILVSRSLVGFHDAVLLDQVVQFVAQLLILLMAWLYSIKCSISTRVQDAVVTQSLLKQALDGMLWHASRQCATTQLQALDWMLWCTSARARYYLIMMGTWC